MCHFVSFQSRARCYLTVARWLWTNCVCGDGWGRERGMRLGGEGGG